MASNNQKISIAPLIVPAILVIALIAGLVLVRRSTEMRRGAYYAQTEMFVLPDATIKKNQGDNFSVDLYVNTPAEVTFVKGTVCYGNNISLNLSGASVASAITINKDVFEGLMVANEFDMTGASGKCLTVGVKVPDSLDYQLKSGTVKVAAIKFKAVSVGSGTISINKATAMSEVSGRNSAGADNAVEVTVVRGVSYEIGSGTVNPDDSVLNYRVSFRSLPEDAKCAVSWPIAITVRAGSVSKTYTDKPVREGNDFVGSLRLTGFTAKENVAVFIKGPKHLQMKYGMDGQTAPYARAGGSISLTNSADTSPRYNFAGYPIVAGDVTGPDSLPDGWVNGLDFSFVKGKSLTHESVDEGGYLQADLDGNCQVNSNDVNVLKISLNEKQGEMY